MQPPKNSIVGFGRLALGRAGTRCHALRGAAVLLLAATPVLGQVSMQIVAGSLYASAGSSSRLP